MKGLPFLSKMVYKRVLISGGVSPYKPLLSITRDTAIPHHTHWNKSCQLVLRKPGQVRKSKTSGSPVEKKHLANYFWFR